MEDIIRYIFIAFIVISFLRSIFKKKPVPGQKPGSGEASPPVNKKPDNTGYDTSFKNDRGMDYGTGLEYNNSTGKYEVKQTGEYIKPEDDPRNYKFGTYVPPKPAQGSDEYAILRELENLFNPDQKPQTTRPTAGGNVNKQPESFEHQQSASEVTQDPYERSIKVQKMDTSLRTSDHFIKESRLDRSVRKSDHEITTYKRDRPAKVSQEQEDLAKSFAAHTKKRDDSFILFNKDLRSRLRHPETLKDYVIISEILGKPKAFD